MAILMPLTVAALVPALLVMWSPARWGDGLPEGVRLALGALGVLLGLVGLALLVATVRLFAAEGRGTLAPWDPTTRLVVVGVYRRVRNPMISGVGAVLLGEVLATRVTALLVWWGAFAIVNATYIPLVEEPGLVRRFGDDYRRYRDAVPRWLPRRTAWDPESAER